MIRLKNHLLVLFCLLAFALVPSTASAQSPCHLLTSADPIPEDFGAAYNLFSPTKELLLEVDCGPASDITLQVGQGEDSLYIYKTAYEWTGSSWRKLALSGQEVVGDWYLGSAATNLTPSEAQLAEDNFVVAYTCVRDGSRWKCGCRDASCSTSHWQLQAFTYASGSADGGPDDDGTIGTDLQQQYPDLYDEDLPYNGLFYGLPFSSDAFHPVRISSSAETSMRFRPERSGNVSRLTFNNRYNRGTQTGYSSGNGGLVHVELRTDDGTSRHWPTNTVLGKTNSYVPTSISAQFATLTFASPVQVEAGKLYHMVFIQGASNYFSINGMANTALNDPLGGPYFGNDFFMLQKSGGTWKRASDGALYPKYVMSSLSIGYSDGSWIGHAAGWANFNNTHTFGGNRHVRQVFTVQGPTRKVNGVWFRVARRSGSAPLKVEVKDSSGSVMISRSVPASDISAGDMDNKAAASTPIQWVYVAFPSVLTFQSGSKYSIQLSSSGAYQIKGMFDVEAWGFAKDRNAWSNAQAEISSNSGSSWSNKIENANLDFGFGFTLEGGPKSIDSVGGSESIMGP